MSETDVLVIGAGPVGLTLAAELARRGVHSRVVDQSVGMAVPVVPVVVRMVVLVVARVVERRRDPEAGPPVSMRPRIGVAMHTTAMPVCVRARERSGDFSQLRRWASLRTFCQRAVSVVSAARTASWEPVRGLAGMTHARTTWPFLERVQTVEPSLLRASVDP